MFYFVCEGEKNKSEYQLISSIIELYNINNYEYNIITCDGNKNIKRNLKHVYNICNKDDRVVLFFDNIENIGDVSVKDLLLNYSSLFRNKGVVFRYTTYYCYEELYLSYTYLPSLINIKYKDIVCYIQELLLNGQNYYDFIDVDYLSKFFKSDLSNLTREELSASILSMVTSRTIGNFSITKSIIGKCWINDCDNVNLNEHVCNKCKYNLRTVRDKIEDLDRNSVSKFSEPFSTIFD